MSGFLYLHGFASGPSSRKARFFADRFAQLGIGLEIPDLPQGDFEHLTITGQLGVIEQVAAGRPVSLIGSSMGGYLAALYAARHPEVEKIVLLAPAFSLTARWPEMIGESAMTEWRRTGTLNVFHYSEGREMPLGYQLIEDASRYEAYPVILQPAIIFHGKNDAVVPASYSVEFERRYPHIKLHLLESDHELLNVLDEIWIASEKFLFADVQEAGSSTRS